MDYEYAAQIVKKYGLKRGDIAMICRVHPSQVSNWMNGRGELKTEQMKKYHVT